MGVFGTPYARFSQFVRSPRSVLAYLKAIARGGEQRYVGHNPAGGATVVALILTMTATSTSGWAPTTDAFWGVTGMQRLHSALADGLLLLVCAHLAGVMLASFRHRENLVVAMINGQKRGSKRRCLSCHVKYVHVVLKRSWLKNHRLRERPNVQSSPIRNDLPAPMAAHRCKQYPNG
jgi:cytochrome b